MWKPKKVPKRSKDVVKKSLQAAREEEKEEEVEQHVQPNNPFEKYEQNNTLSIRVNNELDQLAAMYEGRFKVVENYHRFGELAHEPFESIFFTYNPILLIVGEKGAGKTTFINWLLGWQRYPPTPDSSRRTTFKSTEHFVVLEQEGPLSKVPGEKVVNMENKPFTILRGFQPEINTCLTMYNHQDSQILRDVTIIDTPSGCGALHTSSGQFVAAVLETLSHLADRIYFLLDAEKLLQSTEATLYSPDTLEISYLLTGDEKKVAFVITNCGSLTHEQKEELEHKIVWTMSKLFSCWIAPPIFFGCFTSSVQVPVKEKTRVDQWHMDIFGDVENMLRHKVLHVADVMIQRGQELITLSYVVRLIIAKRTYFRRNLVLKHLSKLFSAAQEVCKRPLTEFPSVEVVHRKLQDIDINTLQLPSAPMLQEIEKMIYREIPEIVEDHLRKMRHMLEDMPYMPSGSLDLDKL